MDETLNRHVTGAGTRPPELVDRDAVIADVVDPRSAGVSPAIEEADVFSA